MMLDTHEKIASLLPTVLGMPSYAFFVLLGMLAGLIYYLADAHGRNAKHEGAIIIVASALIFGMIGSKVPLLFEGYDLKQILAGKSIVGGLIGGFLGVILIKRLLHIKLRLGNIIAPSVALGMAIGRFGCFFGGCCYGKIASWGINFGDGNLRLPTQLFEVAFHLTAFILLHIYRHKAPANGILFKLYLLSYFIFRFIMEFFRENPIILLGMTVYQIICILGILFVGFVMMKRGFFHGRKEKNHI